MITIFTGKLKGSKTMANHPRRPTVVNLDNIEREMTELAATSNIRDHDRRLPQARNLDDPMDHMDHTAPVEPPKHSLPGYVEHAPGIDDIGKLTAQAVVSQFETAAKAIEAMGKDLIQVAKETEDQSAAVLEAIKYIEETAQMYRDEAKKAFQRIQSTSMLLTNIRETCDDLRKKITPE
jgi:hypothetical protein